MFTVLIVDDEPQICHMMRRLFERVGWQSVCVDDSRRAAWTARKIRPGVVLLDLMMPGLDGLDVLAQLRGNPETADLPVVLYTAVSDAQTRARAMAAGASDYIVKPTPVREIVERLARFVPCEGSAGAVMQQSSR
jgi:DNA-binding response OmpR family regulator